MAKKKTDKQPASRLLPQDYELVPVESIQRHPANPRKGDVKTIATSIIANGFYGAIVVQRSTRNILAGNHRYDAAKSEGLKHIPAIVIDVADEQALKILLVDNKSNDDATYDQVALAELLTSFRADTGGFDGTGYDDAAFDAVVAAAGDIALAGAASDDDEPAAAIAEDETPPLDRAEEFRKSWGVEAGQVWNIPSKTTPGASHRIMAGDSTSPEQVKRLLDGHAPGLMSTDPPYGVKYDPSWRSEYHDGAGNNTVGTILNDDRADWREVWKLWAVPVLYIWHGGLHAATVSDSLTALDYQIRAQIIWNKTSMVFGRGAYHWKHEPCWYAVRKGSTAEWQGDRKQTTVWDCGNGSSGAGRSQDEDDGFKAGHISQKPVDLFRRPMVNHTKPGDYVAEPFSGSGSQLVAAERLGRLCLAMELDPKFVAVALERLKALGLEPTLDTASVG